MTNLVSAFQRKDIAEFEQILKGKRKKKRIIKRYIMNHPSFSKP